MIDHLADLDADFRRFYGIAGVGDRRFPAGMTGPRFLALAHRVGVYGGVVTELVRRQEERSGQKGWGATAPREAQGGDVEVVEATPAALRAHPATAGVIDI